VAVTRAYLARIETLGRRLNTFITVLGDTALKAAAESERRYEAGTPLGPLDGVPIAVKDVFYISGVRCTAGSRILADNVATYDAPVVRYLRDAGAVLVGTTNMHEFAAGVTSTNPHYGAVKNPWDESRVAGGSSGGSAVAVATGMAEGAIGTDTAGSVRIPAALCGVMGFKPTYGRVSRLGVVPLAPSFDTVGVLALNAWDTAAMLQVMARHDGADMTTVDEPVPNYLDSISVPFSGARVGVVRRYFQDTLDPLVQENFESFASRLCDIGCTVEEADLEGVQDVYDRWVLIRRAEATAFHMRWLESSPELYGDDVRKLLELGRRVLAVDYVDALNARPAVIERFSDAMRRFDFLMVPATCVAAPGINQANVYIGGRDIATYSALNRLTLPFNYVGFPAVSIPSGLAGNLPLGVQIVGKLFDEARVLSVANAYEEKFGPHPLPPIYE
jgi:aspartyl-tRNA(Asn)/glutamyl-tRNA(Gln) amidotransferase subunit A